MNAVIKRELRAYVTSPLGYVVIGALLLFSGIYYSSLFGGDNRSGFADLTYVFQSMITIIFFIIPLLTMRTFSEERNKKTDQLLFTSPVNITSIVLGKFFAALSFFSIYLVYLIICNSVFLLIGAQPAWSVFFSNILGLLLFAASLIAIGIFISSLTESQVVAAVGSFAVSFFLLVINDISLGIPLLNNLFKWISFSERYYVFSFGIINIANIIFFLSFISIFLFLTIRTIDRRRWA